MTRQFLLAVLLAAVAVAARADEAAIRKAVEAFVGGDAKVEGIEKAGFLDLYEVRIATREGTRILYTDEGVTHIIIGSVYDAKTEADLTDARLRKLNAIRFDELPLAQSFKIVRGNGTRQLAYFSDPRCPYCRKFDQALQDVDDVTVHVFLIPIIAPDSAAAAKAVWCSPDRAKAWLDLMLKGIEPPAPKASCETPLDKNLALSRKYRINGTPTLIFADGQRVAGWMPADRLSKMLTEAVPKK
ncbi:MAG TPA: DsbC family protein [Burkholderiales bacterium]|nr:DsbC family protein [Burkholderiales bacterium]